MKILRIMSKKEWRRKWLPSGSTMVLGLLFDLALAVCFVGLVFLFLD